jgi:hypothetical protein
MRRNLGKTVIKGAPLSITPAGIFDSYKIEVEDAQQSPFLVGQIIKVNLPRGLRLNIGELTGMDLSQDAIYSINGAIKAIEIEGFSGTQFTGYSPVKNYYSFISLVSSNGGKPLLTVAVSGINVLIREDGKNIQSPSLWLSPRKQMRLLRYNYMKTINYAIHKYEKLQNISDILKDPNMQNDLKEIKIQANRLLCLGPDGYCRDNWDLEGNHCRCESGSDCETCPIAGHCENCCGDCDNCYIECGEYENCDIGDLLCTDNCENCSFVYKEYKNNSEDDFECSGDCENCPVTCEEDTDDEDGDFECSGCDSLPKDFGTLFAEMLGCGEKKHAEKPKRQTVKPVTKETQAFDDCPFAGENEKYFRAFAEAGEKGGPKAAEKLKEYMNTICRVCRHNEICNSKHITEFSSMNDTEDRDISLAEQRGEKGDTVTLPDYFGRLLYSYDSTDSSGRTAKKSINYSGLFVKNLTGAVTLVPGILPLFDPHTCILSCVEICGLPEEAFNSLYRIIKEGGCPAVYINIPDTGHDIEITSSDSFAETHIRSKDGIPLNPDRIIICNAAEGYSSDLTASIRNIRNKAKRKGKK